MSDKKNKSNTRKPQMNYCSKCIIPSSYPSGLTFDVNNVCSACVVTKEKYDLNFKERKWLASFI